MKQKIIFYTVIIINLIVISIFPFTDNVLITNTEFDFEKISKELKELDLLNKMLVIKLDKNLISSYGDLRIKFNYDQIIGSHQVAEDSESILIHNGEKIKIIPISNKIPANSLIFFLSEDDLIKFKKILLIKNIRYSGIFIESDILSILKNSMFFMLLSYILFILSGMDSINKYRVIKLPVYVPLLIWIFIILYSNNNLLYFPIPFSLIGLKNMLLDSWTNIYDLVDFNLNAFTYSAFLFTSNVLVSIFSIYKAIKNL